MADKRPPVEERLEIHALDRKGHGVARWGERTLTVPRALPGELVVARIDKRPRRRPRVLGTTVEVAARERVTPPCAHFSTCSGCSLQHVAIDVQREWKQAALAELFAAQRVEIPALAPPLSASTIGYRRRARLGAKWVPAKGRVVVGFREIDGRFVADISRCEVLPPGLEDLPCALSELLTGLSIRAGVPQIELTRGQHEDVIVVRVLAQPDPQDLRALAEFARSRSMRLLLQPGGLDTLVELDGAPARDVVVRLRALDSDLDASAVGFVQVHAEVNDLLIERVLQLAAPDRATRVLDLYCGLGNFSLPLARVAQQVVGVEYDPALLRRAATNAARAGLENVETRAANLEDARTVEDVLSLPAGVVVLDPPRSGAEAVCQVLAGQSRTRIVYVACGPAALARDAAILVAGGYRVGSLGIADMFPHTMHWETVACFERGKSAPTSASASDAAHAALKAIECE